MSVIHELHKDNLRQKTAEQNESQRQHMSDKEYTRSLKDDLKSLVKKEEHQVIAVFDLEIDNKTKHTYLGNEHEGTKGSCEVATCDMNFLKKMKNQRKKVVYFFSNKYAGQNLNRMFLIVIKFIIKLNMEKIELIYVQAIHKMKMTIHIPW